MHEAEFYQRLSNGRVRCTLCPHDCAIVEGGRGACAVRYNVGDKLYTLVYDPIVASTIDPIEKKPLFHFFPGSTAYSVATVGCNLRCAFCQNWEIAQWPKEHLPRRFAAGTEGDGASLLASEASFARRVPGRAITPRQIVEEAVESGSRSIAYTYTEPTIFYELARDTALLAREQGLKNVFVTSAFISEEPLRRIAPLLDAVNIDLKFFREESYRRISRARLKPVLDAIRLYHDLGVWTEVTTLIMPGVNDSDDELRQIAGFVCSVGAEVPWHVSRFHPSYKMLEVPPTPPETLRRAAEIGREAGLRYVYEGNVPGRGGEHTYCYNCGKLLIERYGFRVLSSHLSDGSCPECWTRLDGVGIDLDASRSERLEGS